MPTDDVLPRFADGVVLRRLSVSDLPAFQAYRSDPLVGRYQAWTAKSDAEAGAFLIEMNTARLFQPGKWSQVGGLMFEQTNANRVFGITDARNLRSIRLLERVGMRMTGSRDAMCREQPCVEHVFAISRLEGR